MGGTFDPIHNGHLMLGDMHIVNLSWIRSEHAEWKSLAPQQDNVFQTTREDRMEMVTRSIESMIATNAGRL